MKIAIVDDEPSLIMLAKHTISDYCLENHIDVNISEFACGKDFLSAYNPGFFDIVFMDVFMPGISGIDTVKKLRESDQNVAVIFLTTSEEHMKGALSCHAFDYLVKPAARSDFFRVLSECIDMLSDKGLINSKYIEFKAKGLNIRLLADQIVYVVANGHVISVRSVDGSDYEAKETFSNLADALSDCSNMLVINRGVLVNMDNISRIEDGNCYLSDGSCFAVKIKAIKSIEQAYQDYKLSRR